jgi:cyclic pyranopterin phosphate synthase
MTPAPVADALGRRLRNLRLSVTDRCNLRCQYCMPEPTYVWLPRQDLLRFEEIGALVDIFAALGVERLRLTGGEPLLRHQLDRLVAMLAAKDGIHDLALTTNGILLAEQAPLLFDAGLHRVTVSLDTLRPDRFAALTRYDALPKVLAGIEAAIRAGFCHLKVDTVVMRGTNDDEMFDIIEYGRQIDAEVRFIEYMDVGGATRWSMSQVVCRDEILRRVGERYGSVTPLGGDGSAPAERFKLPDGTVFGVIASTTAPFCRSCDRSRLTADGMWYLCLYARTGLNLRDALRGGVSAAEIESMITSAWSQRSDRGAEDRLADHERQPSVEVGELHEDPHLEMHTRGG